MSCIPEIAIQSCDTGQRIHFFDSGQLNAYFARAAHMHLVATFIQQKTTFRPTENL